MTDDDLDTDGSLSPERTAAFIDAAVAIALTLLILPLMESVTDHTDDPTITGWFREHGEQLTSFVVSFVMILLFWMIHHRLFRGIHVVPTALMWLAGGWLLTIVWLPVATSMSGAFTSDDALTRAVYIGSLVLVCVMSFVVRAYVRAHPAITTESRAHLTDGMAVDASLIILFTAALVIAVLVPAIGYWALLIMFFGGLLQTLLRRLWR